MECRTTGCSGITGCRVSWRYFSGRFACRGVICLQRLNVLTNRSTIAPVIIIFPVALAAGIGFHDACINSKTLTPHKVCIDAALQHLFKDIPDFQKL